MRRLEHRKLALALVLCIALGGAEDKVRHPAARIQVELDRPGGRIEAGLALRNQRKILHVQLPLQHAYDLIRPKKSLEVNDPVTKPYSPAYRSSTAGLGWAAAFAVPTRCSVSRSSSLHTYSSMSASAA